MRRTTSMAAIAALVGLGLTGCMKPIPNQSSETGAGKSAAAKVKGVADKAYSVATFYDEDFQQGGFTYTYGGNTKISQAEGQGADGSEYFLHTTQDVREYSGVAVCLWNMSFDLTPYIATGALVFQARSKLGGEIAVVGLGDDEKSDGWKSCVRVPLSKYGTFKKGEWTTFVIPLRDFGKRGVAWDATKQVEIPWPFQWDLVQEFRMTTNRGDNPEFEVDIDNIQIMADAVGADNAPVVEDWLDKDKSSDGPTPEQVKLNDEIAGTFFGDEYPAGGFAFGYGGKTTQKVLDCNTPGNKGVWAIYFENEWSGVDVSIGNNSYMDLTKYRKTGSVTFWVKAGPGAKKYMVGIIDNQGNDKKVQTKVVGESYAVLKEGEWVQVRIPLKAFMDDGAYWDAKAGREFPSKMDWSKIQEFRVSIGKDDNKVAEGTPITFYVDQVQITKTSKGIYDPDAYWDAFKSTEPTKLVDDFTKFGDKWIAQHGSSADIKIAVTPLPKGAPPSVTGQALKVDFKPGDWFDAQIRTPGNDGLFTDWSKHYGLLVWLYTDKPFQSFDFVIQDRDHEMFLTKVGAGRGWNQILIPFRNFFKFPYYQPPEAKQNNLLDLDGVFLYGIKPGGEVSGTLYLAKIEVTNLRELPKVKQPPVLPATFNGSLSKTIQKIPDIYGINVGLWAPEMLDASSVKLQKAAHWGSVRYPGGLRSDWEDWEKTLKDKDFLVDTDEFLDWCAEVNCDPMFTANVGDGSPERAARWVEYVNKKRTKGPKVNHWEIGNEIYGDWHKYYEKWGKDGGVAYGKAVREYVKAMKAVDPDIKISAVWKLTGDWNKTVFKECGDVIDGVNVHHYAQTSGTENDAGLLAVSQESDVLMKDVRKQIDEYGVKGKKYEIWLSEWNSVDFNPGPQILQPVEALFVADYLGHLAGAPIQLANLWAMYNGRDKRMGDNGVLGTSGDPKGLNHRNPSYWAMLMMANTLTGSLLEGSSDQEALQSWISKRDDGKYSIVFVNKNPETDYKTTIKVPGLKGEATVEVLTTANSGGLKSNEPTGDVNDDSGPKSETKTLGDGSTIVVPKYSIVTIRFK